MINFFYTAINTYRDSSDINNLDDKILLISKMEFQQNNIDYNNFI